MSVGGRDATSWQPSAREVAEATGGTLLGAPDVTIRGFATDSRRVAQGGLFVALRDERDGHEFVDHAWAQGAHAVLVEQELAPPDARTAIVVPDALRALGDLGRVRRGQLAGATAVAITGSTGKTSTKDLTATALAAGARVHASPASWNNEFGVPLTVLAAPDDVELLVTELGERRPGDLAYLCEIVTPAIGVVTNVGLSHAEHLGGPEGVLAVLGELVDHLDPSSTLILDADDEPSAPLRARARGRLVTVGTDAADVRIASVVLDDELRVRATYETPWGVVDVALPLRGVHHARNAALALAVAGVAGIDVAAAAAALRDTPAADWRMHVRVSAAGIVVINDAYNANPASMRAGLEALAARPGAGRRVAVLGEMRELGAWSVDAHAEVGRLVATLGLDALVVVGAGESATALAAAARAAGVETVAVDSVAEASAWSAAELAPGDAVLVKASRAVGLERVAHALLDGEGPLEDGEGRA